MTLTVDRQTLDLMTVNEAAHELRLSPAAVLALVHRGELKASRLGKVYRIERDSVIDVGTRIKMQAH